MTPFAVSIVPGMMPPIWRRPRNTSVSSPLASRSVASSVGVRPHGCTRTATILPLTATRSCEGAASIASDPATGAIVGSWVDSRAVAGPIRSCARAAARTSPRGRPNASARPTCRWYGTIVTLQCGRSASASAIEPAVRSCSRRCHTRVCWMRGISTVTSVSRSPSSAATSSSVARFSRRSGSSWISSETRARPRRVQAAVRSSVRTGSRSKWMTR